MPLTNLLQLDPAPPSSALESHVLQEMRRAIVLLTALQSTTARFTLVSKRLPASIHTPTVTVSSGVYCDATRMPLGSVVTSRDHQQTLARPHLGGRLLAGRKLTLQRGHPSPRDRREAPVACQKR